MIGNMRRILIIGLTPFLFSGCSAYMATHQPSHKNLDVLLPNTDRDLVIAELGAPITSEPSTEGKKDIYTFIQGYDKLNKTSRALFHGLADVLTIGIWEVIGTPFEGAFDGEKLSVRVIFNADNKVKEATTLSTAKPNH